MIGFLLASGALAISLGDCAVLPAETALDRFEEMLVSGSAAAEVGFADCLAELNLLHSAQRHYLQVVRSGSRDDAWHAAVDRAMALVDHTGDPHSVQPYIQGIDAREVRTEHGHDALFYVHANNLIAEGQHELAAVRLENVDPRSPWGPAAIYAQARAIDATGRVDPALDLYGKVHEAPLEVEARIRRAVLLSASGRTEDALEELVPVLSDPERSGFAATSRARLYLELERPGMARSSAGEARRLARLDVYVPDADLVAAEVAAHECRVGRADRLLDRRDHEWKSVRIALDVVANVGHLDGRTVFAQWYGPDPVEWDLPQAVYRQARVRDLARARLLNHLDLLDDEIERIAAISFPGFQTVIAPHLVQVVADGRGRLEYLVGQAHGRALREMHAELVLYESAAERLREQMANCGAH